MKRYLAIICLIAACEIAASAQNLSQMVTTPTAAGSNKTVSLAIAPNHSANDKIVKTADTVSDNATDTGDEAHIINETPLVNIEVFGLHSPVLNYQLPPKTRKTLLERASEINDDAIFQRKRFEETGQPIVIDTDHLYYRRDAFSYTKGIVFYKFMNGKMDFGVFRGSFSPANTVLSGRINASSYQQDSNAALFRNGARVFFALRMRLPTR